jgi:hypothetical protein
MTARLGSRSLSDIAVRVEAQAVRPDARPREEPEVYSLEYIEDFFGPSTTLADFFSILPEGEW